MSKQTYIFVDGKLVEKSEAMKAHTVNIMRDIEPYQNMKDLGWINHVHSIKSSCVNTI